MRRLLTRWCKRYLERRGHYVVAPGAVEMVLSGQWSAVGNGHEGYLVVPPHPKASLAALNYAVISLTPGWDKPAFHAEPTGKRYLGPNSCAH